MHIPSVISTSVVKTILRYTQRFITLLQHWYIALLKNGHVLTYRLCNICFDPVDILYFHSPVVIIKQLPTSTSCGLLCSDKH